MRLYTFQSLGFVKTLLETGQATCDTYFMSETSEDKYDKYLYNHLLNKGIDLKDSAPIWCFANYPSYSDLSLGKAILQSFYDIVCWYKFQGRCLIELEIEDSYGIYLYNDLKFTDEYKVNDFNIMDKARVIAKVLPLLSKEQVRGIYTFNNITVEDYTSDLYYQNPKINQAELNSYLRSYVNRVYRSSVKLIDLRKCLKVSILYSSTDSLILKPFIFDIDSYIDVDKLEFNNYISV